MTPFVLADSWQIMRETLMFLWPCIIDIICKQPTRPNNNNLLIISIICRLVTYHQPAASLVYYTTSCKHSLVLLRMGEIIARNMLNWLKLQKKKTVIVASSWLFILLYLEKPYNLFVKNRRNLSWCTFHPVKHSFLEYTGPACQCVGNVSSNLYLL